MMGGYWETGIWENVAVVQKICGNRDTAYRGLVMEWKYMEVYGSIWKCWGSGLPAYRKHGQILTFAVEDDAVGSCLSPRGCAIDDTGGLRHTDTDFDPKTW